MSNTNLRVLKQAVAEYQASGLTHTRLPVYLLAEILEQWHEERIELEALRRLIKDRS